MMQQRATKLNMIYTCTLKFFINLPGALETPVIFSFAHLLVSKAHYII